MENEKRLILIVDDQLDNINQIIDYFKKYQLPYQILRAFDGQMALKILEKTIPDLVITDWEMPNMDGIELTQKLSEKESTKDIPVIMCTGVMTTSQNLRTALQAGAVDYIKKPIDSIELTARINSMLKLSSLYKQVKEKNAGLLLQKKEIELQNEEIINQRDTINTQFRQLESVLAKLTESERDLAELNAAKDKFLSILAHDLRGPLNSLSGFSSLLAKYADQMSKEEIKQVAHDLDKNVKISSRYLENLLTWARSQMNALDFKPEWLSLRKSVDTTVELLSAMAEAKNIKLELHLPNNVEVFADANQLQTIFTNLVTNALKFTNQKGMVNISAIDNGDGFVQLSIADTGVGLSEQVKHKIFRIDTKHTTKGTEGEVGTGLGLLLCREFVMKNGGKIWVESQEGVGTTFYFTIPSRH